MEFLQSELSRKAVQQLFNTKFYNYDPPIPDPGLLRQEKAILLIKNF